jgi:hypothetical protein
LIEVRVLPKALPAYPIMLSGMAHFFSQRLHLPFCTPPLLRLSWAHGVLSSFSYLLGSTVPLVKLRSLDSLNIRLQYAGPLRSQGAGAKKALFIPLGWLTDTQDDPSSFYSTIWSGLLAAFASSDILVSVLTEQSLADLRKC